MSSKLPRFYVGDKVCELSSGKGGTGTVIERYPFEEEYRYVVAFENGREEVFFEKELRPIERSK